MKIFAAIQRHDDSRESGLFLASSQEALLAQLQEHIREFEDDMGYARTEPKDFFMVADAFSTYGGQIEYEEREVL